MAIENKMSYEEFVGKLNTSNIQTTWLAEGETNFEEYGNALSGELKQELMDSFDCEQDYKLQEQIASLYKNNSVLQSGDFIASCEAMGLNVQVSYQETSYIIDAKNAAATGEVTNGAIAVYTISDGQGGEIKIADANGNGALESEEIFMNQILGDINNEIGQIADGNVVSSSKSNHSVSDVNPISTINNDEELEKLKKEKEKQEKIAKEKAEKAEKEELEKMKKKEKEQMQNKFNAIYENALKKGMSTVQAQAEARIKTHNHNMSYTGSMNKKVLVKA